MPNTHHIEAFLAEKNLNIRLQRFAPGERYFQITNEKEYFILDFVWYAETPGDPDTPMVKFFVNTTPSSEQFPRRNPARALFHTTNALLWFDTLVHVFYQDLGDYTCSIQTGATDAAYFKRKGYAPFRPERGGITHRYTVARRIEHAPRETVAPIPLPEATLDLLDSIQMRYIPQEKLFVTHNLTGRRRYTHGDINWANNRLTTTFNSSPASREYPQFLKDRTRSREEDLAILEAIAKSIADVQGPIELTLRSGQHDADLLERNDYTKAPQGRFVWRKTITP